MNFTQFNAFEYQVHPIPLCSTLLYCSGLSCTGLYCALLSVLCCHDYCTVQWLEGSCALQTAAAQVTKLGRPGL